MSEENYYSNSNKDKAKFKDLVSFVETLNLEQKKKLIKKIQIENYFNELETYEVINNSD